MRMYLADSTRTVAMFEQAAKDLDRQVESLLRQEARALAVDIGRLTLPLGFNAEPSPRFLDWILFDIKQVFTTWEDPVSLFKFIERHLGRNKASAYWSMIRNGRLDAAAKFLRNLRGIPRDIDPAAHRAARKFGYGRNERGKVAYKTQAASLATPQRLVAYYRKKGDLAGFAKAGWYAAAKSLGGRVRTGGGASGATASIFPRWVTRHARGASSIGGSRSSGSNCQRKIVVWSGVRHAYDALTWKNQSADYNIMQAEDMSVARFRKALDHGIRFRNRRLTIAA